MKRFALSAALIAAAVIGTGDTANAGRHGLFSGGSYGSAGSSGGSVGSYASAGSSGGSYGSLGDSAGSSGGSSGASTGFLRKRLLKRAAQSSGGSYGSTGSTGGSYGSIGASHGSSGGSSGGPTRRQLRLEDRRARRAASHGSSGGASHGGSSGAPTPVYAVPAASHGGSYGYQASSSPAASYQLASVSTPAPAAQHRMVAAPAPAVQQSFAYVVVTLPEDATLYLGGNKTASEGAVRKFKIPVNGADSSHDYDVRVVLNRNGQNYVARSTETLQAGKTVSVKVNDVETSSDVQVAGL